MPTPAEILTELATILTIVQQDGGDLIDVLTVLIHNITHWSQM